jgi:hypothetical protein
MTSTSMSPAPQDLAGSTTSGGVLLPGDQLCFTQGVRKRDHCRVLFLQMQTESLDEHPARLSGLMEDKSVAE